VRAGIRVEVVDDHARLAVPALADPLEFAGGEPRGSEQNQQRCELSNKPEQLHGISGAHEALALYCPAPTAAIVAIPCSADRTG
jgi:hypothetical protein